MLKNIYFHVGTVKTGSTLIQKMLWYNRDIIKKFDFEYVDLAPPKLNYGRYANAEFLFDPEVSVSRSRLENYLDNVSVTNLVISEEGFWVNGMDLINNPAFDGYNKIIVLYVRRPADAIASWSSEITLPYNALVKLRGYEGGLLPISLGIKRLTEYYSERFYKLFSAVDRYDFHDVIVRPYEISQLSKGDIFCDFLKVLSIDPDEFFGCDGVRVFESENVGKTRKYCDVSSTVLEIVRDLGAKDKYSEKAVEYVYNNCIGGDDRRVIETLDDECIEEISDALKFVEDVISEQFLSGEILFKDRFPSVYKNGRPRYQPVSREEIEKLTYRYLWEKTDSDFRRYKTKRQWIKRYLSDPLKKLIISGK